MAAGVFSYFAKAQVALPFPMDLVEVPQDLFQLYIPTTILNGKFDSMVGAMSLFGFALVTATALAGGLRLEARRRLRFAAVSALSLAVAVLATRVLLAEIVDTSYTKTETLRNMHLSRSALPMAVYRQPPPVAASLLALDPMERVLQRRTLRVGYVEHRVPFSFHNARGELVGFDVEMAACSRSRSWRSSRPSARAGPTTRRGRHSVLAGGGTERGTLQDGAPADAVAVRAGRHPGDARRRCTSSGARPPAARSATQWRHAPA